MSDTDREYGVSILDRHLSAAMRLNAMRNMAQLEDPIGPASVGQFTRETLRDGLAVMTRHRDMGPPGRFDPEVSQARRLDVNPGPQVPSYPPGGSISCAIRAAHPGELAELIGMTTGSSSERGLIEVVRHDLIFDPFPRPVEISDADVRRVRDEMGGVAEFLDQVMGQFGDGPAFPPLVSTPRTAPAPIEPEYMLPRIVSGEGAEYHAYSIPFGRIPEQTIVGNVGVYHGGVYHGDDDAIRVGGVQIGVAEPAEPQPYMISQVDRAARAITVGPQAPSYPPPGAQSNEILDEVTRREILLHGWREGDPAPARADAGPARHCEAPATASSVILPADAVAGEIPIGTTRPNHTFSWDRFQTDLDPTMFELRPVSVRELGDGQVEIHAVLETASLGPNRNGDLFPGGRTAPELAGLPARPASMELAHYATFAGRYARFASSMHDGLVANAPRVDAFRVVAYREWDDGPLFDVEVRWRERVTRRVFRCVRDYEDTVYCRDCGPHGCFPRRHDVVARVDGLLGRGRVHDVDGPTIEVARPAPAPIRVDELPSETARISGPRYPVSFDRITTPRFAPAASPPAEPEIEMIPAEIAAPVAGTINISGDRPRLQNVTMDAYFVFQRRLSALRESLREYFTQPGRNPTVLLRVVAYHDYGGFDLDLSLSSVPNWTLHHLHVRRGDDLATAMYPNPSDLRAVVRRDLVDRGFPQFVPRCTTYRVEMEPFVAGEGPVPPPPAERGQVYGDVSRLVQADFG